jgi:hypothetical protein
LPQQEFRHLHRTFLLTHHSCRQRRQAIHQNRPRTLGRQYAAKVFAVQHQRIEVSAGADYRAAHFGSEPTDIFGEAVNHDVDAVLEGPLALGRGEGIVHHDADFLYFGTAMIQVIDPVANGAKIDQFHRRVNRRFAINYSAESGAQALLRARFLRRAFLRHEWLLVFVWNPQEVNNPANGRAILAGPPS